MTAKKRKRRTLSIESIDKNDIKLTCTTLIEYKPLQQFLKEILQSTNMKTECFQNNFEVPRTRVPANRMFLKMNVFEELSKEVCACISPMEEALRFFDDFFGRCELKKANRRTSILVQENEDFEAALKPMRDCLDFFKDCWLSDGNHQIGEDSFKIV